MIKADLKTFSKSIDNINSTLQKIDELANTALNQIIDLYEQSKKIHVITQDDIVPLSSIFPAEQLVIKSLPSNKDEPTTSPPPRRVRRKATEPVEPPATEPVEPPATEPEESKGESGEEKAEASTTSQPDE